MRIWAVARSTAIGLAAVALPAPAAPASSDTSPASESQQDQTAVDPVEQQADVPSDEAMRTMTWVAASGDNFGLPYIIIDKVAAEVFVLRSRQPNGRSGACAGWNEGWRRIVARRGGSRTVCHSTGRPDDAGRKIRCKVRPCGGWPGRVVGRDYSTAISLHAVITRIGGAASGRNLPQVTHPGRQSDHLRLHQCPGRIHTRTS